MSSPLWRWSYMCVFSWSAARKPLHLATLHFHVAALMQLNGGNHNFNGIFNELALRQARSHVENTTGFIFSIEMAIEKTRSPWKFFKSSPFTSWPYYMHMSFVPLSCVLNRAVLLTYEPCGFRYVSAIQTRSCLQWAPGIQPECVGSWVIFGRISAAAPWEWRIMTHPTTNTSSAGSSGCSRGDRFGKHFKKCRNREGHVKASVLLQSELTSSGWA